MVRARDGFNDLVVGTPDNDALAGLSGADTMVGGLGDDTYYVDDPGDVVDEDENGGIDTVISYLPTTVLARNVENLTLSGSSNKSGYGNALANIVRGHAGNNVLDGGAGDDLLYGGGGTDVFVVRAGNGSDAIGDFKAGPTSASIVSLVGYGLTSFDQIKAAMVQDDTTVVLNLGNGETLRFLNQAVQNFSADDFRSGLDTSKWTQTFGDEFDTFDRFNGVDGTWTTRFPRDGFSGFTNPTRGEQQVYVDSEFRGAPAKSAPEALGLNPFSVQDGSLEITARETPAQALSWAGNRKYYSGLISSFSSFQQTYGYFEMRAKMPAGQALWPAFWLLPVDGGAITELDVVEMLGQSPFNSLVAAHSGVTGKRTADTFLNLTPDLNADYHTFGMDWGPKTITWYFDGVAVGSAATPADLQNRSMYMIANLAVGGNWAGLPNAGTLADDPSLRIDYIRAYATENTVSTGAVRRSRGGVDGVIDDLFGTALNDSLSGNDQNDKLSGAAGDDTLSGGADNDTIGGGAGNDVIDGGTGIDVALYAGDLSRLVVVRDLDTDVYTVIDTGSVDNQGTDQLTGIETLRFRRIDDVSGDVLGSTDVALTDAVDAVVRRNPDGSRVLTVGDASVAPFLPATAGIDTVEFTGRGVIRLADGFETLTSTATPYGTTLIGNAGANTLRSGPGGTRFVGLAGDDLFVGSSPLASDTVDYSLDAADGGTAGVSVNLAGGLATDGFGGRDTLVGIAHATGTASGDTIVGSGLANVLQGLGGNDMLSGGAGDDRLDGGAGDDTLDGGAGADQLIGGDGANTASYASAAAGLTADLGNAANNTGDAAGDRYNRISALVGSGYDDSLTGSAAADILRGGGGGDTLAGLNGADLLFGEDGDDLLLGGAGSDTIDGGAGNDRLAGGIGYDRLTGGAGADTFVFAAADGKTSMDTVTDFTSGVDKLEVQLSGLVDPSRLSEIRLLTGMAVPTSAPSAALFYETGSGRLWWEPGGAASGNVLLATLSGNPTLTAGDVTIV
ncbi:family 16 glycosylhydrolase [Methylobacterium oryzihabitans]|nr:family 16 glycosylhydrolase [Methylobacterium oryzihabitans]